MNGPRYVYVIVRADLPIPQQAVQACHACLEASKHFPWQGDHPHLVLLTVPDEASLRKWLSQVDGLKVIPFFEPDLNNSLTAIAVSDVVSKSDRKIFSSLKTFNPISTKEKSMGNFQSRWGYHPCSYETFRKLKRLNFLWFQGIRRVAAWHRWNRKAPQNRVIRRRTPGQPGDRRTREIVGPMPEPICPPMLKHGDLIAYDYRDARTPVVLSQVPKLRLSEDMIDKYLEQMEEWYKQ